MADHSELTQQLPDTSHTRHYTLAPNLKGAISAIQAGAKQLAIITSPSETFCRKNTNCSVAESLAQCAQILALAQKNNIPVRGYVSCVLGCPYQGKVDIKEVIGISQQLLELGCWQISLGDTIGVGTPQQAQNLIKTLSQELPIDKLAVHFHDTYGQALANIYACLEAGITTIDSAAAGLGGCPYAKGASGNVATEDVLYMLHGLGSHTHIDIKQVIKASQPIIDFLGLTNRSKVAQALLGENP